MNPVEYNPRYLAYCRHNGRSPEDQLAHDRERWPGGCMFGFVLWIGHRWNEWHAASRLVRYVAVLGPEDHASFDRFIGAAASAPDPAIAVDELRGER